MSSPPSDSAARLKAGLIALKQTDYDAAIALLRQVPQGSDHEQAQRALIVAYDKLEKFEPAIALCYPLSCSTNPETQAWAQKSLTTLKRRAKRQAAETAEAPTAMFVDPPFVDPPFVDPLTAAPEIAAGMAVNPPQPGANAGENSGANSGANPEAAAAGIGSLKRDPRWRPLGPGPGGLGRRSLERGLGPLRLRAEEWLTIWVMVGWVPFSLDWLIQTLNRVVLMRIPGWHPQIPAWTPLVQPLQLAALVLLLTLPWGLRLLLGSFGPTRSLSLADLAVYSPDGAALIRRFFPSAYEPLVLLESRAPLILSAAYGPREGGGVQHRILGGKIFGGRIFLSQGLLDRLDNAAIAALIAAELGQFDNHASLVLPWLTGLLQLPYGLYRLFSAWGNRCHQKLQGDLDAGFKLLARLGLIFSGLLAAIAYGLFKLWRWPLLWLSRSRVIQGDRAAVDRLGNPHAYAQALQAYGQALCAAVGEQGQTEPLLEAVELLLPLGVPVALTVNFGAVSLADRLAWDCVNPYRHWLNLNNAHPLLGDRLHRLQQSAQRCQIPPAIPLPKPEQGSLNPLRAIFSQARFQARFQARTVAAKRQALRACLSLWPALLHQGAPFFGAIAGILFALLLWMLGATASLFGLWSMDWVLGDRNLIWGLIPMGMGLGLIVRTNGFFPQKARRETVPAIAARELLGDLQRLPLAAAPVEFNGKLIGRPQVGNWLGQDLLLQTDDGLLRLHWCSPLGPAGNLWPRFLRPSRLIGREVRVTGWLRRGATVWLDVEQLQTLSGGRSSQRGHPMWAAVMAAIAVLWGSLILLRMG